MLQSVAVRVTTARSTSNQGALLDNTYSLAAEHLSRALDEYGPGEAGICRLFARFLLISSSRTWIIAASKANR